MKRSVRAIKFDMIVEFYDPHDGIAGCILPYPIKQALDKLNGKKVTLKRAIELLEKVVRKITSGGWLINIKDRQIFLTLYENKKNKKDGRTFFWRLIRFK